MDTKTRRAEKKLRACKSWKGESFEPRGRGTTVGRCANRNRPGTSRPCPCCVPRNAVRKARVLAKRARALGKAEVAKAAE